MAEGVTTVEAKPQGDVPMVGGELETAGPVDESVPAREAEGAKKRRASSELPDEVDEQPEQERKAPAKKGVAKPVKPKKKATPKKKIKGDRIASLSPDPIGRPLKPESLVEPTPEDQQPAEQYRKMLEDLIEMMWEDEATDSPTYYKKLKQMPFEELYPTSVYCKAMHYIEKAVGKLDRIAIMAKHSAETQAKKRAEAEKRVAREERIQRDAAKAAGVTYKTWKKARFEAQQAFEASTAKHQQKLIKEHGTQAKAKVFLFNMLVEQNREDEPEELLHPEASASATEANEERPEDAQVASAEIGEAQPNTHHAVQAPLEFAQNDVPKPTQETFPESVRDIVAEPSAAAQAPAEDDMAAAFNASVFDEEQNAPPTSAKIREAEVNRLLAEINAPFVEQAPPPPLANQGETSSTPAEVSEPIEDLRAYDLPPVPTGPLMPPPGGSLPGLFAQPPRSTAPTPSQPQVEQDEAEPAGEQGDVVDEHLPAAADESELGEEEAGKMPAQQSQRRALPPASTAASTSTSSIPPYRRPSEMLEDETDYDDSPVQGAFEEGSAPTAASEQEGDHDEELFGAEDGSDGNPYEKDEVADQGDDVTVENADEEDADEEDEGVDQDDEVADQEDNEIADQGDEEIADQGDDEVADEDEGAYGDEDGNGDEDGDEIEADEEDDRDEWLKERGMARPVLPKGWKS